MRFTLIALTVLALVGTASSLALSSFFDRYSAMERHMRRELKMESATANSIKHALASADVFNVLRAPLGDDLAETIVVKLGLFNEYLERITYAHDKDSTREIMKDLHNNYAGITAAKLAEPDDLFQIMLSFAANSTLILNADYNPFYKGQEPDVQDVVAFSYKWFKENNEKIDSRLERKIARAKELRDLLPLELSSINPETIAQR